LIQFLDTSALAKRYLAERGSRELRAGLKRAQIAVARITYAEMFAAVARACREGIIDEAGRERIFAAVAEDFRELTVVEVRGSTLMSVPDLVRRHPLRGYDAVQLACALTLHRAGASVTFWSGDERLCQAARAEALRTMRA
jgi:hypothetical protein